MATLLGARNGARAGALIGAVGGLVFVLGNAGSAGGPWPTILRLVGLVLFAVSVVLVLRQPPLPLGLHRTRGQMRAYGWIVLAEGLAIPIGAALLTRALGLDNAALPWVVIVLGVHFVVFERVFPHAGFAALGVVLTVVGVVTLVMAFAGADDAAVIVCSAVVAGFVLFAWVLGGVARGPGPRSA